MSDHIVQISERDFLEESLRLEAITHKSYAYENPKETGGLYNERLEFLGDSVVSCVAADYLYDRFPDYEEGQLTTLRAKLICKQTLAHFAMQLGLNDNLRLGIGALSSNARNNEKVLEDLFEAYIGAVFLDTKRNYDEVRKFMEPLLTPKVDELIKDGDFSKPTPTPSKTKVKSPVGPVKDESVSKNLPHEDPVNKFQTWSQRRGLGVPQYKEVKVEGSDHNPEFTFEAFVNGKSFGTGKAKNKKEAKKKAAIDALEKLFPSENKIKKSDDDLVEKGLNNLNIDVK